MEKTKIGTMFKLTPSSGKKLYNGDVISDEVFCPDDEATRCWSEITDEQAAEIETQRQAETEPQQEPTE